MRRLLANLVLLVMLWGYLAPARLGATEAELPACCRGNGKHHCSMASMAQTSMAQPAGDGFSANPPQCPYRLLGSMRNGSSVGEAKRFFSLALPAADLFAQRDSALCVSGARIRHSGRSPPALSL
jgi:hypothetical protein